MIVSFRISALNLRSKTGVWPGCRQFRRRRYLFQNFCHLAYWTHFKIKSTSCIDIQRGSIKRLNRLKKLHLSSEQLSSTTICFIRSKNDFIFIVTINASTGNSMTKNSVSYSNQLLNEVARNAKEDELREKINYMAASVGGEEFAKHVAREIIARTQPQHRPGGQKVAYPSGKRQLWHFHGRHIREHRAPTWRNREPGSGACPTGYLI